MESNISRDHIALEAMKIILKESFGLSRTNTLFNRIGVALGLSKNKSNSFFNDKNIAKLSYEMADEMIKEREKEVGNE